MSGEAEHEGKYHKQDNARRNIQCQLTIHDIYNMYAGLATKVDRMGDNEKIIPSIVGAAEADATRVKVFVTQVTTITADGVRRDYEP